MATPLNAPMPPNLNLGPGYTVRITALAVSDGSVVSAVNVSNLSILAADTVGDGGASLEVADYYLVPGSSG